MIYLTGDTHADIDIKKLNSEEFPAGSSLTRDDYVIICGDFGFIFDAELRSAALKAGKMKTSALSDPYESKFEKWWLKWLESKPWTTLFVDGNHENHERLSAMRVYTWHGGKVHKIRPNVIHLMRGQIFDIDGCSIFTFGGASSHDKEYRREHVSWWSGELPGDEEYEEGLRNLAARGSKVDYIVTHCLPDSIQDRIADHYEHDRLTNYLEHCIFREVSFKKWYCGHYHMDAQIGRFNILYQRKVLIGESAGTKIR